MNPSNYRVRRATLEDIGQLVAMWQSMNFAPGELARRITEFQVVVSPEGALVGALGIQVAERQGRIYCEAFTDFALAEHLRPMLWDRVHTLATNLGLLRLWTQENAPFWHHCGLVRSDAEALAKLPEPWRSLPTDWLTVKLREDPEAIVSADQQFAMFVQAEKERSQRALTHARMLKSIVTLIAVLLLVCILGAALYLMVKRRRLMGH
jgi:N-acetylglutamate synthase-like GNAT family acetyltransferase